MARSILITDEIYYFYRLNRQGQRTSQNLESYFDMVEAVDGSVDEGLKHIVDNRAGELGCCIDCAGWPCGEWQLIPPDLLGSYAARIADVFERVPRGWWQSLLRLPGAVTGRGNLLC